MSLVCPLPNLNSYPHSLTTPGTLEALLRLQAQVEDQTTADMLVELCLLIPAPLSSLLQHLSLLLQPVILALRSRDELAHLGLRTLELWIDSLNPDYLYPIMSSQPSLSELVKSLCDLLRPDASTQQQRELALRLLGKLGGRNRWFLKDASKLNDLSISKPSFGMNLNIEGTWNLSVPFDQISSSIVSFVEEHLNISTSSQDEDRMISPSAKALIVSSATTLKWNHGTNSETSSNTTFVQTRRSKRARTSTNLGASLIRRDLETSDESDVDETRRRNSIPHPRENYVAQLPRATFVKYKKRAVELSRAFLASVLSISSSSETTSQNLIEVARGQLNLDMSSVSLKNGEGKTQDLEENDEDEEVEEVAKRMEQDAEKERDSIQHFNSFAVTEALYVFFSCGVSSFS